MAVTSTLELALEYVFYNPKRFIFPVRRGQKTPPLIPDNLNKGTTDEKLIEWWHRKWPGCNWAVGLRQSFLFGIDIDNKIGHVGQATWAEYELLYGIPPTETVLSPSGNNSRHLYFDASEHGHIFKLGKFGFGVDVDSPNYLLIPGCPLDKYDGRTYRSVPSPRMAKAPLWFYDVLQRREMGGPVDQEAMANLDIQENIDWAVDYLHNDAPQSIAGQGGESTTLHVAGTLKDHGISYERAIDLMQEHYNTYRRPMKTKVGPDDPLVEDSVPLCIPEWSVEDDCKTEDSLLVKIRNSFHYLRKRAPGELTIEADFTKSREETMEELGITEEWLAHGRAMHENRDRSQEGFKADPKPEDAKTEEQQAQAEAEAEPPKKAKPHDPYAELCEDWVYICTQKWFIKKEPNSQEDLILDIQAFNNKFQQLRGDYKTTSQKLFDKNYPRSVRRPDTIVYQPGQEPFMNNGRQYNAYRPSDVTAAEGDTSIWDEHLAYLFPDQEQRDHLLNWLGWVIQNLDKKPMHALLIAGRRQGTGKSFIELTMRRIIGAHNVSTVDEESLESPFNEWAMKTKLIVIEELRALDSRRVKKKLHPLITQTSIRVNDKNVKRFQIENCFAILAMTNEDAAIPLEDGERRYLVIRTDTEPKEIAYYHRLYSVLQDEKLVAAIAHQLKTRDLGAYDGRMQAPMTKAKAVMVDAGLSELERWMMDNSGMAPLNRRIVSVDDVINALPGRLVNQPRLAGNIISILKARFKAKDLGQVRLDKNRRPRLWSINVPLLSAVDDWEGSIKAIYESEQEVSAKDALDDVTKDFS